MATVYSQIFGVYHFAWRSILTIGLAVFVPLGLFDAALNHVDLGALDLSEGLAILAILAGAGAITTSGLLGEVFFAGVVSVALTHPEHERVPPLRHIARELSWWRLIAIDLLYVLAVAIGSVLLIVPGVLAFVLLGLAGPTVELEDRRVRGAIARSVRLVRTDFWLVFWVLLPVEVFGDLVGAGVERLLRDALGDGFFSSWLAESASNLVLSPLFAIAAVLLSVRLIRELDGSGPRLRSLAGNA